MIKCKDGILERLKQNGHSTYQLRYDKETKNRIGQAQIQVIREGKTISMATLDTLCRLLECQPNEIIEHVPDPEGYERKPRGLKAKKIKEGKEPQADSD